MNPSQSQQNSTSAKSNIEAVGMDQSIVSAAASAVIKKAEWLLSLGCAPLPVAPLQDAEKYPALDKSGKIIRKKDGTPEPKFNGKNPSFLGTNGKPYLIAHSKFNNALPSESDLKKWFTNPANGIGTLAGQGGIDWIDLDRKNFESQQACDNARSMILEKCDRTYFETTRSGGAHVAVKLAEPKDFTVFKVGPGGKRAGEFLGAGLFIVLAPTTGYESLNGDEIAVVKSAESLGVYPVRTAAGTEVKSIVSNEPPVPIEALISKKQKDFLKSGKSDDVSQSVTALARELFAVAEWYPSKGLPVTGDPKKVLQQAAGQTGINSDRLQRILEGIPTTGNLPALVKYGSEEKAIAFFHKKQKSDIEPDKLCAELRKIRDLRAFYDDRLKFNQLSQKIEVDGEPCEDIEGERINYIEATNKTVGVDLFCSVVRVIANESAYHPVADYLGKVADLHPNVDPNIFSDIAHRYFGASDPMYSVYVKRWMLSAVARALRPGCKVDTALFLFGGQGRKKSTFFKTLAGEDFFSDSLGDVQSNKDEILLLSKFWVHEWAELETIFRKKEMASVKSFMARTSDTVRPPYRRDLIDLKRSCVFAGSTNEQNFLSDNTGDRRFWVIPMKQDVPVALVKAERDQLWAAAVALFRAGEQWWLTDEEDEQRQELNEQFRSVDSWQEKISMFIAGRPYISTNEILNECFEIELKNIGRREQLRVSGVMTALGWEQGFKKIAGKSVRKWLPPMLPSSGPYFDEAEVEPEPQQQQPEKPSVAEAVAHIEAHEFNKAQFTEYLRPFVAIDEVFAANVSRKLSPKALENLSKR